MPYFILTIVRDKEFTMFLNKPTNKKFNYQPRFYIPEKDDKERKKRKLGFRNHRSTRKKGKSSLYWIIFFAIIAYLYLHLKEII